MEYRLLIDLEVIEILESLPRNTRRSIRARFGTLRSTPAQFNDYTEYDHVGRRVKVNVFAGYCIHYWIDSADRHVKVMEITSAGRG